MDASWPVELLVELETDAPGEWVAIGGPVARAEKLVFVRCIDREGYFIDDYVYLSCTDWPGSLKLWFLADPLSPADHCQPRISSAWYHWWRRGGPRNCPKRRGGTRFYSFGDWGGHVFRRTRQLPFYFASSRQGLLYREVEAEMFRKLEESAE